MTQVYQSLYLTTLLHHNLIFINYLCALMCCLYYVTLEPFQQFGENLMNKNKLACGCIPTSLSGLPSTIFAEDPSNNQAAKEKTPIELQRGQLQPLTLV